MRDYLKSQRFKTAIINTVVAMIVFPGILTAVSAIGGSAPMSWDSVRSHVWPDTFIFGLLYGVFTTGFGYFLFSKEKELDEG